jgi:two-component system response regulator
LVLLDLNMPRMDGREVLRAVAGDERLKLLPIVVLTTSEAAEDVITSYRLGSNSYIIKPASFEDFSKVIQSLTDYWFKHVVLPPKA